jgi:hypothetical protein
MSNSTPDVMTQLLRFSTCRDEYVTEYPYNQGAVIA